MSIEIEITQQEYDVISEALSRDADFICLDRLAQIKATLVAREMLMRGKQVKAKIMAMDSSTLNLSSDTIQ